MAPFVPPDKGGSGPLLAPWNGRNYEGRETIWTLVVS